MSVVDPVPAARGVRTRGLGWSMLWAVLLFLVTNLGALLTNYLTTVFVTPVQTAAVSTGVSLVVVLVGVVIDYAKGRREPDQARDSLAGDAPPVNEVSATAGSLKATVTGVRTTGRVTLVDLVATNSGDETMELPVFGRTLLSVPGGTTLEGDPFRSKWAQSV